MDNRTDGAPADRSGVLTYDPSTTDVSTTGIQVARDVRTCYSSGHKGMRGIAARQYAKVPLSHEARSAGVVEPY